MASTLYVVADGVSGPPGFGVTGGPSFCPPTGFNGTGWVCGCWLCGAVACCGFVCAKLVAKRPRTPGSETATMSAIDNAKANDATITVLRVCWVVIPVR